MKNDTDILADFPLVSENFSLKVGDCFFIQMSVRGSVVAGTDVRSLRT
jgi:hypothetical protein